MPNMNRPARVCGHCSAKVATRSDAYFREIFVQHLDRGRYCPGSKQPAVADCLMAPFRGTVQ